MRRTDRLFEILQLFRGGGLLLGRDIAAKLEVSLRTVYRDIDTLVASGIPIEGERGVGFILREPIFLPPLALTLEELRALHLGMAVVRQTGDDALAEGARRLIDKVDAVVPSQLRRVDPLQEMSIYASIASIPCQHLQAVRQAVSERQLIEIQYNSLKGERTTRRIRPLQTEYWGRVWTCAAWCETRQAFRVFRIDRIEACRPTGATFADEDGKRYADYLAQLTFDRDDKTTTGDRQGTPITEDRE